MIGASAPDRGDVVWLDLTPQAGNELAGRRPALVLSPVDYNKKSRLMLCCSVTSRVKGYPFEVSVVTVAAAEKVTGVALADQVRCLVWHARNASKFSAVTKQCALDVSAKGKLVLP